MTSLGEKVAVVVNGDILVWGEGVGVASRVHEGVHHLR